jgi:protein phosphatase
MKLSSVATTDKGMVRDLNEDRAWQQVFNPSEGEPVGLFIVSDGMGGTMGGEVASHWAVETIRRELADLFINPDPRNTVRLSDAEIQNAVNGILPTHRLPANALEERVRNAVIRANQVVRGYAYHKPEQAADAGATLTLALVKGNTAIIANVGDSRTYLIRKSGIHQVTNDHSLVATMVASGQIRPEDVYTHPQRNVVYRSLGQKDEINVDIFHEMFHPGDILLLCSDGLWEMVRDEQMLAIIQSTPVLDQVAGRLVDAANAAGGDDNISVVLCRMK